MILLKTETFKRTITGDEDINIVGYADDTVLIPGKEDDVILAVYL